MKFCVWLGSSLLALSLAACGGGGGGGEAPASDSGVSAPVVDPAPQAFSISGDWRAMSLGGIYTVSINGGNGVIEFTRPDEVSGATQRVVMAGMSRGSDGAYIFRSGFVVGGLALDVALYRVDNNTMAGQILSSRNGSMRRSPVILTRNWAKDLSSMPGDWVSADVGCEYEQSKGRCEYEVNATEVAPLEASFMSIRFNTSSFSFCAVSELINVADCPSGGLVQLGLTDLGDGRFDVLGDQSFVFGVGGSDLMFNHAKEGQATVLTNMGLSARDSALAAGAFGGVWRAAADDGRTGAVTVNGEAVTIEIDGRAPISGKLTRNQPLRATGLLELDGQAYPYYWVGNEKLVLVSGNLGYFLLHRE